MISETLILSKLEQDLSKTFHWSASVKAGRNVVTKTRVKKPRKAKVESPNQNQKFNQRWHCKHTPEQVIEMVELHTVHGWTQVAVCKKYGVVNGTVNRMMELGGLYARAKQEVAK